MPTNPTRLLIGSTPVDIATTTVRPRPARMFTLESLRNDAPLGEIHLGTGGPGLFGSGPLIDVLSGDPEFFEQLSVAAAEVARSMRELSNHV